ncbi:MAG: site-2 protease family protein [Bacteroidota bacterium]
MSDVQPSRPRFTPGVLLLHAGLFLGAFLTTTLAGVQWLNRDPLDPSNFASGLPYSLLLMAVLGTHEMGHYIAARRHRVEATLPYFLPFPSLDIFAALNPFGTVGAVIRLRSEIPSRRALFDIGAAGPLAGFALSAGILLWGLATLPPVEYLYEIHPEYRGMDSIPLAGWVFGRSLFYQLAEGAAAPGAFLPPMNEIYHYPMLCVGWFGMLVTSINLIPIGQLDGGHISYAMFGVRYHIIAQSALIALVILGLAGLLPVAGIAFDYGYAGWLFWAFLLIAFLRVPRLRRPPVADDTPLGTGRRVFGWVAAAVFVGSFSLTPFSFVIP